MGNHVAIHWRDICVYHDGGTYKPTDVYTEGVLYHENDDYVVIKNPETILFSEHGPENYPEKKASWYFIPKALISEMIHHT